MSGQPKLLFKITDVPTVEAPAGGMRNSVIVSEETCGSTAFTAGILTVPPGGGSYVDRHEVQEFYYVIGGHGTVTVNGVAYRVEAGDVLFLPAQWEHQIANNGGQTLAILWVAGEAFSRLPEIRDELAKWPVVRRADR